MRFSSIQQNLYPLVRYITFSLQFIPSQRYPAKIIPQCIAATMASDLHRTSIVGKNVSKPIKPDILTVNYLSMQNVIIRSILYRALPERYQNRIFWSPSLQGLRHGVVCDPTVGSVHNINSAHIRLIKLRGLN